VLLHYLAKQKNENFIFTRCINALPEFNQSLLDFFSLFDSRLILMLLYDSLNIVTNAFSSGLLGAWFKRKEVESAAAVGTVLHAQCTSALSSGFLLSQGNAEALDMRGEKTDLRLISCFLSNTSAKNYCSRIVSVKIIASQRWGVFETQCTSMLGGTHNPADPRAFGSSTSRFVPRPHCYPIDCLR